MDKLKLTFPHMGDYGIVAKYLFEHILNVDVFISPPITNKTIEIGNKYSPNFVCTPFKYTLGTMIEGLDKNADIIVQAGGGCRYGYYGELQEKILKDLDYNFEFINLVTCGKTDLKKISSMLKKIDPKFSKIKAIYYLIIARNMVKYMDDIDDIIRSNVGFEIDKGSFKRLKTRMLNSFSKTRSLFGLRRNYKNFKKEFLNLKTNKPKRPIKIGIIGELYTVMEPFANYELENMLALYGMEVKRFTNVNYLLFEKHKKIKKYLKYAKKYIKYKMGSDAADNIARTKYLCENDYDGIIHIKSSFCTPEIGAMPIINKICKEYNVPIIFFSFDSSTSEVGIKTRIEAFYDMIEMRRKNEKMLYRN